MVEEIIKEMKMEEMMCDYYKIKRNIDDFLDWIDKEFNRTREDWHIYVPYARDAFEQEMKLEYKFDFLHDMLDELGEEFCCFDDIFEKINEIRNKNRDFITDEDRKEYW